MFNNQNGDKPFQGHGRKNPKQQQQCQGSYQLSALEYQVYRICTTFINKVNKYLADIFGF